MKKLIIQVARLDKNYQNKLQFEYKSDKEVIKSNNYSVTSIFFKEEVLKDKECDILFLFPISLPIQDFQDTNDEYLRDCQSLVIDEYINNNYESIASEHPHVKGNKLLVIPSIGTYRKNNKEFSFKSNIETITLHILTKLVRYYIDDLDELYVDISGGQNIYNVSLLLAINRFMPMYELYHSFKKKIIAKIIYSDPIILGTNVSNINVSEITAKAFFELSYKSFDDIQSFLQKNITNYEHRSKYISFYKTYLPALFYSVKMGFVLLIPHLLKKMDEDKINPYPLENYSLDLKIDLKEYFNVINKLYFANSIYFGLKEIFKQLPLIFEIYYYKYKNVDNIELTNDDEYLGYFEQFNVSHVYKRFSSELENILKETDFDKLKNSDDFTDNFLKESYKLNTNFNPRNYSAHNGLEKNSILLRMTGETDDYYVIQIQQKNIFDKLESIVRYSSRN